jgi:DNA (cytosine-5)-methyltransferase 1
MPPISSWIKSRRAQNDTDWETWIEGGVTPTLNAFDNATETRATVLIIDGTRVNDVRVYEDEVMQTVIQRWGTGGGNVPAIYSIREDAKANNFSATETDTALALQANRPSVQSHHAQIFIAEPVRVRRLTPLECERLQGFPDGWTGDQADSNRYKQMGNAVAVPVVQWIINNVVGE